MTALEPVEVPADELAAAEAFMAEVVEMYPAGQLGGYVAEYDRRGAAESELIQYHNEGHALLVDVVAERDRLTAVAEAARVLHKVQFGRPKTLEYHALGAALEALDGGDRG